MAITILSALAVLALIFRYDLAFTEACKHLGLELSETKIGTGLQDAITPPAKTNLTIFLWLTSICLVGILFFCFGWMQGVFGLILFLIASTVGALLVPRPQSAHFIRLIYRSMVNRYANFVKKNDVIRAEAMKGLIEKLEALHSDKLVS